MDSEIYTCEICSVPMPNYKPQYCCGGLSNDCYCLGQPTEPPVCSKECCDKFEKATEESYKNNLRLKTVQFHPFDKKL